jgi:hypothetical protein
MPRNVGQLCEFLGRDLNAELNSSMKHLSNGVPHIVVFS